jgi:putative sterol carrier protein
MALVETLKYKANELNPHFKAGLLQRDLTIFNFSFEQEDSFFLCVTNCAFTFEAGASVTPTLTLSLDCHDTCWRLLTGELNGMDAFMAGKYRADGNIVLSQMLLYIFKIDDLVLIHQVRD